MPTENSSALPYLVFLIPAGLALLVWLVGRFQSRVQEALVLLGTASSFVISLLIARHTINQEILTSWNRELYADALSALVLVIISGVGLFAAIYSQTYMRHQRLLDRVGKDVTERRLTAFYALFLLFVSTMLWGCVTNNVIMLYVAVEATTIASGLLVGFYLDKRGLEAAYKYLMLLTVGITFALFGCVLLYSAATVHLPGVHAFLMSDIRGVAGEIPRSIALLVMAFAIVGFGTKAGIAPFHPWLPDAHAEAPTPISVLLSGVMLKMAVYALARIVMIFYPTFSPVSIFLVALGAFTMLLGIAMALVQDDLKRLLAYSSVSQMGYVVMGVGLGTYLGVYGGLFHMLNHGLSKALLFMCAGAVIYSTGARRISELGGLGKSMPVTSACFFIGALAVSGMPPLNGFMSKITIFIATASAHQWWATGVAMFTSLLTMVVLTHAAWAVFWGQPKCETDGPNTREEIKEAPAGLLIGMVPLAAACVLLGIYPQAVYPMLNAATESMLFFLK